jgi:hypothetical protein
MKNGVTFTRLGCVAVMLCAIALLKTTVVQAQTHSCYYEANADSYWHSNDEYNGGNEASWGTIYAYSAMQTCINWGQSTGQSSCEAACSTGCGGTCGSGVAYCNVGWYIIWDTYTYDPPLSCDPPYFTDYYECS